jgi:electron transport complex protein RnfD
VPGTLALVWFFGWGVLINMALATVFAVSAEALVLKLRGRPVLPAISDYSAVVTALLFALTVPPTLPWWLTLLGILFAIVIVKQLYGGIGYNPFNPAMAGYVFLLISYPVATTSWLPPMCRNSWRRGPGDAVVHGLGAADLHRRTAAELTWDAISAATPLDEMRTLLDQGMRIERDPRSQPALGRLRRSRLGMGRQLVPARRALPDLAARHHLAHPGVFPRRSAGMAGLFWLLDPQTHPHPAFHLFSGAAILGAFFIATDPVSACTTARGQLIYGFADRRAGVRDSHLGRLSGCGRLRRVAAEHRRPNDRPLHAAARLRPGPTRLKPATSSFEASAIRNSRQPHHEQGHPS